MIEALMWWVLTSPLAWDLMAISAVGFGGIFCMWLLAYKG